MDNIYLLSKILKQALMKNEIVEQTSERSRGEYSIHPEILRLANKHLQERANAIEALTQKDKDSLREIEEKIYEIINGHKPNDCLNEFLLK